MTPEQRLEQLRMAEAAGKTLTMLAFWGHRPTPGGQVGAGCLSQWWPAACTVDDVTYPTAEHWMMAGKARLFDDPAGLRAVLAAASPGAAKAAGRKVVGFDQQRWVAARYDLVVAGNLAKFTHHANLREFLLATGDRVLVEASPYYRIWGVGLGPGHPDVLRATTWRGHNLLGFALMDVRDRLRTTPAGPRWADDCGRSPPRPSRPWPGAATRPPRGCGWTSPTRWPPPWPAPASTCPTSR
jgi:ribA/ribD-fused uncharacterized protein